MVKLIFMLNIEGIPQPKDLLIMPRLHICLQNNAYLIGNQGLQL